MKSARIDEYLRNPPRGGALARLAERWREEVWSFRLAGMGGFAACPSLLNKARGAWGRALYEAGSDSTRANRPCDWPRACAADVFFARRPLVSLGGQMAEIPKPFVLRARAAGGDLVISLHVFGLARAWGREAALAFAGALRTRVRWHDLARDGGLFVPRSISLRQYHHEPPPPAAGARIPRQALIRFLAPPDASAGRLSETPELLFARLRMRLCLLARWQGMELEENWPLLEEDWLNCELEVLAAREGRGRAWRGGHKFSNPLEPPFTIRARGNLERLWPLLALGQRAHAGRGATLGLGEYELEPEEG